MTRGRMILAVAAAALFGFDPGLSGVVAAQGRGAAGPQPKYWAPKAKAGVYDPPNRPHVKLSDLKARHAGQASWQEVILQNEHLRAEYISAAPGTTVSPRFQLDTREWWIVVDGQMRVQIEGQEPLVATAGSMIQVPRQTIYSMETIGTSPSLRFVVNHASARTVYPEAQKPAAAPGVEWFPVRFPRQPAPYDERNRPHINLHEAEQAANYRGGPFVWDDYARAQIIYGHEQDLPPLDPNDRGHFHALTAEFWLILSGQIRYDIETVGVFVADRGDVVYAPPSTFHATRFHGPGPSTRLAMGVFSFAGLLDARD